MVGPMARGPNSDFEALGSWEDITDRFVFKIGGDSGRQGRVAIQYAFDSDEQGDWVKDRARDIKVTPFTGVEMNLWLANSQPTSLA
jgi:hypothetical protein